ncbi:hypothetical protein OROMI_014738 [Orobanche minor]
MKMGKFNIFDLVLMVLVIEQLPMIPKAGADRWNLLVPNTGVSAMHMQLLNNDHVVIFDLTDFGPSNISLPNNRCRDNPNDLTLQHDCTAHSIEYNVAANSIRHARWFSLADRRLQRWLQYCQNPSIHATTVPATGRSSPTSSKTEDGMPPITFCPMRSGADLAIELPFHRETRDPTIENNLYPFVFLNVDGNIFIFANNRAILFDYARNVVVRNYPAIPGGDPRNYPSSGSAVLLPLRLGGANAITAEVLVCGGAPFTSANNGNFVPALNTCGRIRITDTNPQWLMETMPQARVMGDMVLLPNGNVLLINGAGAGTAGWTIARNPVLRPLVYRPNGQASSRFQAQNSSSIPRMYHSTAILLHDGRILVSGSNPIYTFTGAGFPTELRMESYSPKYLDPQFARVRPAIVSPASRSQVGYGEQLSIAFTVQDTTIDTAFIYVTMVAPPFTTHSFSMNQRLLVLTGSVTSLGGSNYQVQVSTPASKILAPPGFYLLFIVYREVPSPGIWLQIN